ncbi:hypothetical protein GW915_08135 [bacterium]|nr:hypothetical protein [bacterium]
MSQYLIEAVISCTLLGFISGFLGNFLVVRKMALFGDMIGHAVLPGVCIGFFLSAYEKNIFFIFFGALGAAFVANALHEFLSNKLRIKPDASLAINLTGFYAIGSTMMAWLKDSGKAGQTGLDRYLLGQASSISREDLSFIAVLTLIIVASIFIFYKEIKAACFDYQFSKASGLKPQVFLIFLSSLIAANVIVSLQAVGVILACAFLVIPAATTVFYSQKLLSRLFLGALFGALAGFAGAFFSLSDANVPTGPSIILVSAFVFVLSGIFGPENGWFRKKLGTWKDKRQHQTEDFLRCAYYFYEKSHENKAQLEGVFKRSGIKNPKLFERIRKRLVRGKVIKMNGEDSVSLTDKGLTLAADMVRKHRLWELYLVQMMNFPPERVHANAERVEHLITDKILKEIEDTLSNPDVDPHGKVIPSLNDLRKHGVPGY